MNTLGLVFSGVMLNFLLGLLVAVSLAPRWRQHWLRQAPNFLMFALVLELWPFWGLADLVAAWGNRNF